jgi:hypothetical protein
VSGTTPSPPILREAIGEPRVEKRARKFIEQPMELAHVSPELLDFLKQPLSHRGAR